ncbi:MAG: thiamine diphosphokinase [Termitinemataceae bacterium]|nr:MAG: thiamine diphosphokinase [Termitinemataceae bacterium]
MKERTAVAFTGGDAPTTEICRSIASGAEIIAAADSGLITCETSGLAPQIIAGDMDSIDDIKRLEKYPQKIIFKYECDKDKTDTEIIIDLLWERGHKNIILIGGGGGRLDHLLAIYKIFERKKSPLRWRTKNEDIYNVRANKSLKIETPIGTAISVFKLKGIFANAKSEGLKWPLDKVSWKNGFCGVSNAAVADTIKIKVMHGNFLVICNTCNTKGK